MLFQKIAALFALMVFAPQVVIGRPQGSDNNLETAETHLPSTALGFLSTLPKKLLGAVIEGAGGG